ncbi:hypothetical protein [Rickettsiales endosymbiont of Stachyamoeba lipophora]|uniref:hypothetical protein n=1 Tax=Rickettsiales endosymbiont of Stachyamoeba lipophora TaxID=2486578 RepID=UPI000F64F21D|nr:hypothetical protein [Rickettsiales endosymbiont of Stachyamoeba lipophora]AZL15056.1 hypothetical protein EF513_00545 [Rickettsiales endosymbiont of Stachyamoeba lipophora]
MSFAIKRIEELITDLKEKQTIGHAEKEAKKLKPLIDQAGKFMMNMKDIDPKTRGQYLDKLVDIQKQLNNGIAKEENYLSNVAKLASKSQDLKLKIYQDKPDKLDQIKKLSSQKSKDLDEFKENWIARPKVFVKKIETLKDHAQQKPTLYHR